MTLRIQLFDDNNIGPNLLNGNDVNDTLDGGPGDCTLIGGVGNDSYVVDSTTDTITEYGGEGIDTVNSSVTFSLAAIADAHGKGQWAFVSFVSASTFRVTKKSGEIRKKRDGSQSDQRR